MSRREIQFYINRTVQAIQTANENYTVANLLQSLIVKNFENWIIIGEVMAKSLVSCFFDSRCSTQSVLIRELRR